MIKVVASESKSHLINEELGTKPDGELSVGSSYRDDANKSSARCSSWDRTSLPLKSFELLFRAKHTGIMEYALDRIIGE